MAHTAAKIANQLIKIAEEAGDSLTHLKLQKLVYLSHGWHLALADEPLVDEGIEAWKFGPVVRSLYHKFKKWGDVPITEGVKTVVFRDGKLRFTVAGICDDEYAAEVIKVVWDTYKEFSGAQLSTMTHQPGTPWHQVTSQYPGKTLPRFLHIPDELIREHFSSYLSHAKVN